VTLQRLVDGAGKNWSVEEEMVLDALRLSKLDLADASADELAAYVSGLSTREAFQGAVSNIKGKYHEMLFAKAENTDGDNVGALIAEKTNQPGWDVEFVIDGEVIQQVQLKAVSSPQHIYEHLARYPDIEILATEEVAALVPGIASSGFSNADIETEVRGTLRELYGDSFTDEMIDAASTSALVSAAFVASKALKKGRVDRRELSSAMGDLGIGIVTATVLELFLSPIA
jgi:hypothetical protein